MLSQIPIQLAKVDKNDIDKEILRLAVIAELDAINLYEQMASLAADDNLKKVLLDIAREEKTHVVEFQTLLLMHDKELTQEMEHGKEEIEELFEK